jgi:serine/threonine-protein kinase
VNNGELPLYKAYLSEFVELNRSLQSLGTLAGIQRVADVFSENATAYAVFDDVSGMSVQSYLASVGGTITSEQAFELFKAVFTALERVNTAGIVHRGISPKTVFVYQGVSNPNATVGFNLSNTASFGTFVNVGGKLSSYLSDFAITAARISGSKLNSEVFAGFSAPEQYSETDRHGEWTDAYGLAALLYNAVTGVIPQDAPSRLKEDKLQPPHEINENISPEISETIMKALALSTSERIKSVGEFAKQLGLKKSSGSGGAGKAPITYINPDSVPALPFSDSDAALNNGGQVRQVTRGMDFEFQIDEEDEKTAKRRKRELRKKRKLIAALSAIGALTVVCCSLLFLATCTTVFDNCAPAVTEPSQTSATTTAITTTPVDTPSPDTTTTPNTGAMLGVIDFSLFPFPAGSDFRTHLMTTFPFSFEFVGEYSDDPERPYGTIIGQNIEPGTEIPVGSSIVIRFSFGREFIVLDAPTLRETAEDYRLRIISAGINANRVHIVPMELAHDSGAEEGTVAEVTFANGSSAVNERVRLVDHYPADTNRTADMITVHRAVILPPPPTEPPSPTDTQPTLTESDPST